MTQLQEHDAMVCRACGNEERASEGYPCVECGTFICLMCQLRGVSRCRRCAAKGIPAARPAGLRPASASPAASPVGAPTSAARPAGLRPAGAPQADAAATDGRDVPGPKSGG